MIAFGFVVFGGLISSDKLIVMIARVEETPSFRIRVDVGHRNVDLIAFQSFSNVSQFESSVSLLQVVKI